MSNICIVTVRYCASGGNLIKVNKMLKLGLLRDVSCFLKKAWNIFMWLKMPGMAKDSSLQIEALEVLYF